MTMPKGKKAKEKGPVPYQRETRTKGKKGQKPEPVSLAKLRASLDDQNKELEAFVRETDEQRFFNTASEDDEMEVSDEDDGSEDDGGEDGSEDDGHEDGSEDDGCEDDCNKEVEGTGKY